MNFVLKPSLEHMTLVKIAISLWNQNDVRALISKLSYDDFYLRKWMKIEKRVIEKVPKLFLPQLLKEKVFGVIRPIGIQIFEWMQYCRRYDGQIEYQLRVFQPHLDLIFSAAELCWTPQGTVDRKRTAEMLIRNDNLDVSRRYLLACDYCLEDEIVRFWSRLPADVKDYHWNNFPVIRFWSDNMKSREVGHIFYEDLFDSSVVNRNKIAAKYFLQKLTPQERKEFLEDLIFCVEDAEVLCFLLNEMEEEEQKKVFENNPYIVFKCFLQYPWQSFFIEIADCMWDYLTKISYQNILGDILCNVTYGYKDYNYRKLFREFWQKSPAALKDLIVEEIDNHSLLEYLLDMKDKENIRLILKDASFTAKEKLIYCEEIDEYLTSFIHENEWDFLEFFIQECFPSNEVILKFKEEFEKRVMHSYFKEFFKTKKLEWDQLFTSSDVSICKYSKRSLEDGESSSSK